MSKLMKLFSTLNPYNPLTTTFASGVQASIRTSIESALLPMTGKGFDISESTKAINDTTQQPSVLQATGFEPHVVSAQAALSSPRKAGNTSKAIVSASNNFAGIRHQVSATETIFGTVWLRTSTAKVKSHPKATPRLSGGHLFYLLSLMVADKVRT